MMTRAIRVAMIPLACLALLTVGSRQGQPQVKIGDPPRIPDVALPTPVAPEPAIQTVDQCIGKLEALRKAKMEIEKQELAVAAQLKELLRLQSERLSKLGVLTAPSARVDQSAIFGGLPPVFTQPPVTKEAQEKPIVPQAPK
jgi:hypothetical protein